MEHKHKHRIVARGQRHVRDAGGFTIVEIVVTIFVFAFGIMAITGLLIAVQTLQRNARYFTAATYAAKSEIEHLRSSGDFEDIADGQSFETSLPDTLPSGSGEISVDSDPNAPDSKVVSATVTYAVDGQTKSATVTSTIDPPVDLGD